VHVHELDHIVINTPSVERALAFYTGMLGMEGDRVEEWRAGKVPFPSVRVNAGTLIDLMQIDRTGENMNHLCLVVDPDDVDAIAADQRFDIVSPPVMRYGARGDGRSVYVRDPDGNVVELRSY
jgi:catechol 2,3-dioxygenase-like lactoylglutathione lyase family enzyme